MKNNNDGNPSLYQKQYPFIFYFALSWSLSLMSREDDMVTHKLPVHYRATRKYIFKKNHIKNILCVCIEIKQLAFLKKTPHIFKGHK